MSLEEFLKPSTAATYPWEGEDHTLTVTTVTAPDGPFDDGELEYEIEHPSSCPQAEFGFDEHTYSDWDCDVAGIIRDSSLEFSLKYSGTPVTKPGTYTIRAWGNRYSSMEYIGYEYDDGIHVVDDE